MDDMKFCCPVCDQELGPHDDLYTGRNNDHILGCSRCVEAHGAQDWLFDQVEAQMADAEANEYWRYAV